MMPQPGMNPSQTQSWANRTMASMRQQGKNPADFGMGQPSGGYSAYRPGQAQPKQAPDAVASAYQSPQQQSSQRPPAFRASYQNFDGTTSERPNFQQRDAFIANINQMLGRLQQQSWRQPTGAPQFDFQNMWSQAGDMVQGGWQNPFARRGNQ